MKQKEEEARKKRFLHFTSFLIITHNFVFLLLFYMFRFWNVTWCFWAINICSFLNVTFCLFDLYPVGCKHDDLIRLLPRTKVAQGLIIYVLFMLIKSFWKCAKWDRSVYFVSISHQNNPTHFIFSHSTNISLQFFDIFPMCILYYVASINVMSLRWVRWKDGSSFPGNG